MEAVERVGVPGEQRRGRGAKGFGMPCVPAFRAGTGERGGGQDIDDGAFADVVAAEHDDMAWAMTVEDQARDSVADQRVNQQDLSSEPVGVLAAAEQRPGKRTGAAVGQQAGAFVCVADNTEIRHKPAEKRFHCDHLLLAHQGRSALQRFGERPVHSSDPRA